MFISLGPICRVMQRGHSRRTLLATVAGLGSAALAGCSELSNRPLSSLPDPPPAPVDDISGTKVRSDTVVTLFGDVDLGGENQRSEAEVLTEESDVSELDFHTQHPAAVELEAFTAGTNFDSRSVYLFQARVRACNEFHLTAVTYADGDLDVEFCEGRRPADVACNLDGEGTVGFAIRLPFADIDVSTLGLGMKTGCEGVRHSEIDGLETETGGDR